MISEAIACFLSLILPKSQITSLEVFRTLCLVPKYQLSIHGYESHEIMKICLLHGMKGRTRHHGFSVSACTMKAARGGRRLHNHAWVYWQALT